MQPLYYQEEKPNRWLFYFLLLALLFHLALLIFLFIMRLPETDWKCAIVDTIYEPLIIELTKLQEPEKPKEVPPQKPLPQPIRKPKNYSIEQSYGVPSFQEPRHLTADITPNTAPDQESPHTESVQQSEESIPNDTTETIEQTKAEPTQTPPTPEAELHSEKVQEEREKEPPIQPTGMHEVALKKIGPTQNMQSRQKKDQPERKIDEIERVPARQTNIQLHRPAPTARGASRKFTFSDLAQGFLNQRQDQKGGLPLAFWKKGDPNQRPDKEDWAEISYTDRFCRHLQQHANTDQELQLIVESFDGGEITTVIFAIDESGVLMDIQIVAPSRIPALDNAVIRICKNASPYPPLPKTFPQRTFVHQLNLHTPGHASLARQHRQMQQRQLFSRLR